MAEGTPLVSVIVSTYQRPALLAKTLESIKAQSLGDFECLVVDDCSEDWVANRCIVEDLKDARFRYLKTDKNYGHDGHAKNLGIKEAKGQYISFLDDDDTYRHEAIKILSTYLTESEADVVYGDYLIGKKPGWSIDFSPNGLQRMNFISMCVVMARREALLNVGGFDESIPKFKDWNLWIRLQKNAARFMHVPIIVAEVSVQDISISNKHKVKYNEQGDYLPVIINEDGTERQLFDPVDCAIYSPNTVLGPKEPFKVAIYTLTWNRLELTKIMWESIRDISGYAFEWFVVDQGSTDGTVEWLKTLPENKVRVQYNDKNVGLAAGWNQALAFIRTTGQYDVVVKVDNDAQMLTKDWLKAMVGLFERNSTLVLSPYVEGLEKTPGGVMRQRVNGELPYVIINDTVLGNVPNIGGIVFAHRSDLTKDWKFDETYEGNKDYLLCQYSKALGYSIFYMEEYRVLHQLGTAGQHEKYPEYFNDPSNDSTKS